MNVLCESMSIAEPHLQSLLFVCPIFLPLARALIKNTAILLHKYPNKHAKMANMTGSTLPKRTVRQVVVTVITIVLAAVYTHTADAVGDAPDGNTTLDPEALLKYKVTRQITDIVEIHSKISPCRPHCLTVFGRICFRHVQSASSHGAVHFLFRILHVPLHTMTACFTDICIEPQVTTKTQSIR